MLTVGILAKRVKIGKNLSIRAIGCRNIDLYSQNREVRTGVGEGVPSHADIGPLRPSEPFDVAGAEVQTHWLQSAVVPAKQTVGGYPCDDSFWAWRLPR